MVDTHPKASNDPGVREVWENPEFLVLSRLQIDSIVSNAYWDAWSNVGDEWRLYPVLSIPLTLASATMEVMFPHAAIITVPQAVFDPRAPRSDGDGNRRGGGPSVKVDTSPPPPSNSAAASRQHASYSEGLESSGAALAGRNTEAGAAVPKAAHIRLREAPRRSESPSPASRAEEPATGGTQIPPSGERELSAAPLADSKGEIPKKIPDLARYIRYNKNTNIPVGVGKMPSDKHVDAVEQKCLEYTDQWNTLGAVKAAHEDIELHIEQLYDTAMAALATHPEWMKFTVLLVIGIYFTQLEWTREDTSNPQAELEAAARERAQRSGSSEIFSGYRPRPPVTPNNTVPSLFPVLPLPAVLRRWCPSPQCIFPSSALSRRH
ncbi:hypothetical protein C8T65DRAFT_63262 [Cerioporus squamosus]|nr:hypothetical protein C8T65DRAFT_63262 [Cerioporus squamosus]